MESDKEKEMKGLTWTNGKGRQVGDGGASQYKPVEGRKAEGRIQTAQQGRVQEGTGKARKCNQGAGLEVRPWRKAVAGQGWGMGMQGNAKQWRISRARQGNCWGAKARQVTATFKDCWYTKAARTDCSVQP